MTLVSGEKSIRADGIILMKEKAERDRELYKEIATNRERTSRPLGLQK